jgi:hypothetical protein
MFHLILILIYLPCYKLELPLKHITCVADYIFDTNKNVELKFFEKKEEKGLPFQLHFDKIKAEGMEIKWIDMANLKGEEYANECFELNKTFTDFFYDKDNIFHTLINIAISAFQNIAIQKKILYVNELLKKIKIDYLILSEEYKLSKIKLFY